MGFKFEDVNCDYCGSNDNSFFAKQKDLIHKVDKKVFKVVICKNCGLKFTNPRPTQETIPYFYSNKYSFHSSRSIFTRFSKIIIEELVESFLIKKISAFFPSKINRILIKFLKPKIKDPVLNYLCVNHKRLNDIKFLDIGCGSGVSTNFWGSKSAIIPLSKKIEVFGVEPSYEARKILLSNNIFTFQDINELDNHYEFDIIRLNWSLEHVHSPSKYFEFIKNRLSRNGIAVICVPNADGLLYRINPCALELPVHLYHFDINSLTNYAHKFNLRICQYLTFSYPEMYLFAEKIGLINKKYNFNSMNLQKAYDFQKFHKCLDDTGIGNDILLILEKK
tara:strand:- start:792 stop:1796 length:1005 start_codon:yes stop_codon:yes gene_type:complete